MGKNPQINPKFDVLWVFWYRLICNGIIPEKWRQEDLENSKLSEFSQEKMKGLNVVSENIIFCNHPSSI